MSTACKYCGYRFLSDGAIMAPHSGHVAMAPCLDCESRMEAFKDRESEKQTAARQNVIADFIDRAWEMNRC